MKYLLYLFVSISLLGIIKTARAQNDTLSLCFVSDTQNPVFIEKLYFHSNNNAAARQLIFKSILDSRPNSVFHLGDLVGAGSKTSDWQIIDPFIKDLKKRNINFYPIPGNHEYLYFAKSGINNFKKRFPSIDIHGYSKQFGNTAVVLFNSNFSRLTKKENIEEINWFRNTLRSLESDNKISFIIVGCHHPPFTNSKVVSPAVGDTMMDEFLNAFYNTPKCRLFLSGHAHTYEHFKSHNKDFLVIGGGGGYLHKLYSGKEARFKDLFNYPPDKRMYHYITIKVYKNNFWVDLHMCSEDLKVIKTIPQISFN